MTRRLAILVGVVFAAASAPVAAQPPVDAPAHLSQVDGPVTVLHRLGSEAAVPDLPLLPGDRLQSTTGRAEVILGSGSILHLDTDTTVDISAGNVVRLLEGRVVVSGTLFQDALRVDTPPASVRFQSDGEVRLSLQASTGPASLDVGVVVGDVAIVSDSGVVEVQTGERVLVDEGSAPSLPVAFNSAREDAFYRWSEALLDTRRDTASAAYLPADLAIYGDTFDESGNWSYLAPYGYVWYPTVSAGWRPYHHGHWEHAGDIGWTFVGSDRWSWPTHHYGRWGTTASGAWYWIPASAWSAAWVQWAISPDYVGWCPLGWDNRPVSRFRVEGGHSRPDHGWSVMRSGAFTHRSDATRASIDPSAIPAGRASTFALQRVAPDTAVPRGTVSSARAMPPPPAARGTSASATRGQVRRDDSGLAVPRPHGERGDYRGSATRTAPPEPPPVIYYRGPAIPPDAQRGMRGDRGRSVMPVPGDTTTIGAPADTGVSRSMPPPGSVPVPRVGDRPVPSPAGSFHVHGRPGPTPASPPVAVPRAAPAPASPPPAAAPPRSAPPAASGQGVAVPRSGSPHR